MLLDGAAQMVAVEVGIDLGGEDALVTQHLLHLADAGTPLDEVRGERVAEGVGAQPLVDAGPLGGLAQQREDHHAREASAAVVEKEDVARGRGAGPHLQVTPHAVAGPGADGHQPLLVALAHHAQAALAEEEVLQAQPRELRHAQPARVEELQHGAVAQPLGGGGVDGGDDAVDLLHGEHVGELAPRLGRRDELGGRRVDALLEQHEVEEAAHAAQLPRLRALVAPALVEPLEIALDHLALDLARRHVPLSEHEVGELRQVAHVGLHGVVGEPLFEADIGAVAAPDLSPFFGVFSHRAGSFPKIIRNFAATNIGIILHNIAWTTSHSTSPAPIRSRPRF